MADILGLATFSVDRLMHKLTPLGNWGYCVDERDYVFIVLTSPQYPPVAADRLLLDFRSSFYAAFPEANHETLTASNVDSAFVTTLLGKYNRAQDASSLPNPLLKLQETKAKIQEALQPALAPSSQQQYIQVAGL